MPAVELIPDCGRVAEAWRALEREGDGVAPYLSWDWLEAWRRTHRPRRVVAVKVGEEALGLIEQTGFGRWRFAGWPVSPVRGLLCAPGAEASAWSQLGTWLEEPSRPWGSLDAEGVSAAAAAALPRARDVPTPSFARALPATPDALLAGREYAGLRRKLRRAEREGALVLPGDRDAPACFVALHNLRAAQKGERHPAIGARLAALLGDLEGGTVAVRTFALHVDDDIAGVTVRLDHGETGWFYNAGIDPAQLPLSPGYLLEAASMRDAVERGLRQYDLGPGEYRYKRELGGQESTVHELHAVRPGFHGAVSEAADQAGRARRGLGRRWW